MNAHGDIAYLSATEVAALIAAKQLSPVHVLDALIDRIEARNPSLNAFVHLAFDEAREAARVAEQQVMEMKPCFDDLRYCPVEPFGPTAASVQFPMYFWEGR